MTQSIKKKAGCAQPAQLSVQASASDGNADKITPLADALITDTVNGFVGPFNCCGGDGRGIEVVRSGVLTQRDEAFAIVAIDEDLDHIEVSAEPLPAPADEHLTAADLQRDLGLEHTEVRPCVDSALDAECLANARVVGGVSLELLHQGAEASLDAGWDGRDGGGEGRSRWRTTGGGGAASASEITPRRPLLRTLRADLLAGHGVGEVVRICRLGGDLGRCDR